MNRTSQAIDRFRELVDGARPRSVVFFGGAGVSTESGIPDFRSPSGLFKRTNAYSPETIVSRSFFDAHPKEFFDFYCERMVFRDARPNKAHRKLAALEQAGILSAVVTQNIDGLHQAAGSQNVLELHGSILRNHCLDCGEAFSIDELLSARERSEDGVPRCDCGGIIKPDVVLYEEALATDVVQASVSAIFEAEVLIVAGTSLAVSPAANLIDFYQGKHLIVVNRTPTPADANAEFCIAANVGAVFDW